MRYTIYENEKKKHREERLDTCTDFLIDNIEDLQPLEDVVVSNEQKIVSSAQEKWKNNGYVPEIVDYSNSIYSIQEKWKDNGYSACNKEYDIDTDEISQKWK